MEKCITLIPLLLFYSSIVLAGFPDINALYQEGKDNMAKGDYTAAIERFTRVLSLEPSHEKALLARATAEVFLDKSFSALEDLNAAIKINSRNPESWLRKADINSSLGLDQEAMDDYSRVIELDPGNFDALRKRAILRNIYEDFYGAQDDFRACATLKPDAGIFYLCGLAAYKLDLNEEALEWFNKTLKKEKDNSRYVLARGNVFARMGDYKAALKDYSRAEILDPHVSDIYYKKSLVQRYSQNYIEALTNICRAITLDSLHLEYYQNRVAILELLNEDADILPDLDRIIALDSANLNALLKRGEWYFRNGELQQAQTDYSAYINVNPGNFKVFIERAETFDALNERQEALQDLNKAVDLNPQADKAYYRRGLIHLKNQDAIKACQDFSLAEKFGNKNASEILKSCY